MITVGQNSQPVRCSKHENVCRFGLKFVVGCYIFYLWHFLLMERRKTAVSKCKALLPIILILGLLFSFALANGEEIQIGVAYPTAIDSDTNFIKGVLLAKEKINATGGVSGKSIDFVIRDDENDATTARQIAQAFVDSGIQAVIGHWGSNVCTVVEETYETNHVVMLSPAATSVSLLKPSQNYIFRMIATNAGTAEALAQAFKKLGYENIAIYFSDDVYGVTFSQTVERALHDVGIHVIDRVNTLSTAAMETIGDRWQAFGCDGVVIAAVMPQAAQAIDYIRSLPVAYPIYGAENLARSGVSASLGGNLENIFCVTYDQIDPAFTSSFFEAYGENPDVFAVTGYQSVILICNAMKATGKTDAASIAGYISSLNDYSSIAGILNFDPDTHEIQGQSLALRPAQ